jgi:hypothetical protein
MWGGEEGGVGGRGGEEGWVVGGGGDEVINVPGLL